MNENKSIEIPFGVKDSELKGWEYTIPEGMEAVIKDGKIIVREKESEDERIRKQLLDWFKDCHWDSIDDGTLKRDDIIAWFEKQGYYINFRNKIQIGDEVTRNPDGVLVNLSQFKRKAKQGSQNLANSAKTCKDEPKPAWSEEDEDMVDNIFKAIQYLIKQNKLWGFLEDCLEWLKSLKERYTWKPSDEQMKLLREVQQALLGKDCHNRFVNFMCDLKKLKG